MRLRLGISIAADLSWPMWGRWIFSSIVGTKDGPEAQIQSECSLCPAVTGFKGLARRLMRDFLRLSLMLTWRTVYVLGHAFAHA